MRVRVSGYHLVLALEQSYGSLHIGLTESLLVCVCVCVCVRVRVRVRVRVWGGEREPLIVSTATNTYCSQPRQQHIMFKAAH